MSVRAASMNSWLPQNSAHSRLRVASSSAGAYQLMRQGSITATGDQRDALIVALGTTCEGRASS